MKNLLITILLTSVAFAQYTENFKDYSLNPSAARRLFLAEFTSSGIAADLTGNGNDITIRATGDSITAGISPIISNGNLYYFSGNDYGDANKNVLGSTPFTMGVLFKSSTNPAVNQVFMTEDDESSNRDFIFMDLNSQNKLDITAFVGGSVKFVTTTETGVTYLNNEYHWLMASHDGTNLRIFYDCGNPNTAAAAGALDDDGSELHIATDGKAVPTAFFTGYIATAFIDTVAITTAQEARKIAFLPADWQAITGNVFRPDSADGWAFKQGLANDTIYTAVNLPAGLWDVTITAAPQNISATINSYSQSSYSKTITGETTLNYQIDGSNNYYIGSPDSLVISAITINPAQQSARFPKNPKNIRFPKL